MLIRSDFPRFQPQRPIRFIWETFKTYECLDSTPVILVISSGIGPRYLYVLKALQEILMTVKFEKKKNSINLNQLKKDWEKNPLIKGIQ